LSATFPVSTQTMPRQIGSPRSGWGKTSLGLTRVPYPNSPPVAMTLAGIVARLTSGVCVMVNDNYRVDLMTRE
jgi:hypothetical protein